MKAWLKSFAEQVKRLSFDLLLFVVLVTIGLFMFEAKVDPSTGTTVFVSRWGVPPLIDLIMLKALLITCGVIHAHITRKLLFPKVDWSNGTMTPDKIAALLFYAVIIFGYARGG